MTSTNVTVGFGDRRERPPTRVINPPGGQSKLAFGGEEVVRPNPPRPKYDQQNSSNLFGCMGGADPVARNQSLGKASAPPMADAPPPPAEGAPEVAAEPQAQPPQQFSRGRIPPGGFSAGFW
uniref:Microtubule-associated protein Jupiter n=1 Tax=Phlebotomus kandelakii TaxID=1109342 RepID=A0A6B2EM86_9DIPT